MIASVEHGIYLRQAESGVEDPMGWGIQVTAHYGEEIEHGPDGARQQPVHRPPHCGRRGGGDFHFHGMALASH